MNVYRVSHEDDDRGPYQLRRGYGPLSTLASKIGADHSHPHDDVHPLPWDDGLDDYRAETNDRCGFASEAALYDWFEGWLAQLDEAGYRLHTYRVNRRHVREGMHQLVFNINEAKRVETKRLVEVAA